MRALVIYASRYGNTQRVAEAVAGALRSAGDVAVVHADDAPEVLPRGVDLVVVGGPTEGHRMTEPIAQWFARLRPDALGGVTAAAFDTRLRWPAWLSGSAAKGIERRLRTSGARLPLPAESFFVAGRAPELRPGEGERAAAWAARFLAAVEGRTRGATP